MVGAIRLIGIAFIQLVEINDIRIIVSNGMIVYALARKMGGKK